MIDVDEQARQRIERTGLRAFQRAHAIERGEPWARVMRLYDRILMPAATAGLGIVQLAAVARLLF